MKIAKIIIMLMKIYYIFVVFFSTAQHTAFANVPNYRSFVDRLVDSLVHLEPNLRDASLVGINHIVTVETWSRKDESTLEIVVNNLAFPDVLEENCFGFEKDLEPVRMLTVGDFGVLLTGRSRCSAP